MSKHDLQALAQGINAYDGKLRCVMGELQTMGTFANAPAHVFFNEDDLTDDENAALERVGEASLFSIAARAAQCKSEDDDEYVDYQTLKKAKIKSHNLNPLGWYHEVITFYFGND